MIICFDIDDTITKWNSNRDYVNFEPITEMVDAVNSLYDEGYTIHLFTSRGMTSIGPDRIKEEIVPPLLENLKKIGLKYHKLITHKPPYDLIVDDKAMSPQDFTKWFKNRLNIDRMVE